MISCEGSTTTDAEQAAADAADAAAREAEANLYSFGSYINGSFVNGSIEIDANEYEDNGTALLKVYILDEDNLPSTRKLDVTFTSICAAQGQATFSEITVSTTNGIASTTYGNNACSTSDTISASVSINGVKKVSNGIIETRSSTGSDFLIGSNSGSLFTEGQLEIKFSNLNADGSTLVSAYIVDENSLLSTQEHLITFSSNCSAQAKAIFTKTNVKTNNGVASTTYIVSGCSTSDTITATANLNGKQKVATGTITINSPDYSNKTYSLGSSSGDSFTEGVLEIKTSTIEVGESTFISAYIVDNNKALSDLSHTVKFSSNCVVLDKASFSDISVTTTNGIASTTYTDKSCSVSDAIIAKVTLNGVETVASGNITITDITETPTLFLGKGTGDSFTEGVLEIKPEEITEGSSAKVAAYIVDENKLLTTNNYDVVFNSNCAALGNAQFSNTNFINGIASATYNSQSCTSSDTITAAVTLNGNLTVASTDITINEPEPSEPGEPVITGSSITLFSNSASILTGSSNYIELTALVKDANNNLLPEAEVVFSSDDNAIAILASQSVSDDSGQITAQVSTAGGFKNRPDGVTITARSGSASSSITLYIDGTELTISGVNNSSIDSTENYQIRLTDGTGNGIAAKEIRVSLIQQLNANDQKPYEGVETGIVLGTANSNGIIECANSSTDNSGSCGFQIPFTVSGNFQLKVSAVDSQGDNLTEPESLYITISPDNLKLYITSASTTLETNEIPAK
ncbi:MAG: Ig-like domain-containing protein, partial [Gammaproteobacteria bacterium]|nr:Ig-like domain-containing protein [Gammaproteobacteria bacterium]